MPGQISFGGPFQQLEGSDLKSTDLSSQINGSRTTFTISEQFVDTQLFVFLNGLFQGPPNGSEITVNTSTTFTISMTPLPGDSLTVVYSPLIKTNG
jgi:hypothetical protein